jgi:hypothetical protein
MAPPEPSLREGRTVSRRLDLLRRGRGRVKVGLGCAGEPSQTPPHRRRRVRDTAPKRHGQLDRIGLTISRRGVSPQPSGGPPCRTTLGAASIAAPKRCRCRARWVAIASAGRPRSARAGGDDREAAAPPTNVPGRLFVFEASTPSRPFHGNNREAASLPRHRPPFLCRGQARRRPCRPPPLSAPAEATEESSVGTPSRDRDGRYPPAPSGDIPMWNSLWRALALARVVRLRAATVPPGSAARATQPARDREPRRAHVSPWRSAS